MYRTLPPLNALRVFHIAARYSSFLLAGRELNLSPAAVAYQVRQLEDYLDIALFLRKTRGVELTPAGLAYWHTTAPLLEHVAEETARLISQHAQQETSIHLYTLHAIASKWLLPRLAVCPGVGENINLVAVTHIGPEDRKKADVCISFQAQPDPGMVCERLMEEAVVPVCSPAYLQQHPQLHTVCGLQEHVWLYDIDWEQDWRLWLEAMQLDTGKSVRRLNFSLSSLVIDAAVKGMGIAMGRRQLIQAELASGSLVPLSTQWVNLPQSYYLQAWPEKLQHEPVHELFDWLRSSLCLSV